MNRAATIRLTILSVALCLAVCWIFRSNEAATKLSLLVTAISAAIAALYSLLTYEILGQNSAMAKASVETAVLMERSLRFSQSASLLFSTITTKDPRFQDQSEDVHPIDNEDYRRALAEFSSGGDDREFVFAVIRNKGQASATAVKLAATYSITDNSSLNRESSVLKTASIPIIEASSGIALCIFASKVPTYNDEVKLVSAQLVSSDFYRDAIKEAATSVDVSGDQHNLEHGAHCVIRIA